MNLEHKRVLLTGASGGIGSAVAAALLARGARLMVTGRSLQTLDALRARLGAAPGRVETLVSDLSADGGPERLAQQALAVGPVDLVIHCAGVSSFESFAQADVAALEAMWRTNVLAPMRLTRALLPSMLREGHGRVVAVGSVFGSIGFPYFAGYSASKFALRGFCEALRRELSDSGVGVSYLAPRYTQTALNAGPVEAMARALNMAQDAPHEVAAWIVRSIERDRDEACYGWPERFFVRVNQLLPRLVDGSLRRQRQQMQPFVPVPAVRGTPLMAVPLSKPQRGQIQ